MADASNIKRAIVYVDGFNFYHATYGTKAYPFGWCNWKETAAKYCGPSRDVVAVRYFTTPILSSDVAKVRRQDLHIAAMGTIADVILGTFVPRQIGCPECGHVEHTVREKKTDVNIAVQMVVDAVLRLYDEAFLVTADLDLLPAVRTVVDERLYAALDPGLPPSVPHVTVLFPPHSQYSQEFLEFERNCPRVRCIEMITANIVRFRESLATELKYEFPQHWKLGSTGVGAAVATDPSKRRSASRGRTSEKPLRGRA